MRCGLYWNAFTQEKKEPINATDIRILTNSIPMAEMLENNPTILTMKNVTFPDKLTSAERANFHAGQFFIVIDVVDAVPGNAPFYAYENFEKEALSKGAQASIAVAWGDRMDILTQIKDWVMGELRHVAVAG